MTPDEKDRIEPLEPLQPYQLGLGKAFDALEDAVVVADAGSGTVAYWNAAAERLFGYSKHESIGLPIESLMPARMRELHRAGLARFNRTGRGGYVDSHHSHRAPGTAPGWHRDRYRAHADGVGRHARPRAIRDGHRARHHRARAKTRRCDRATAGFRRN